MAQAEAKTEPSKKPIGFRISGGTFTFRLIPTLITLAMLPGLIGLGYWQIQRLHWKENLIAEIHTRMQEPAIDVGLSVILPDNIPNMNYHPGRASGVFQNDHPLYFNATSVGNGKGGYDLLTPLLLDDGRYLLVNRGWIPYDQKQKPDAASPPADDQNPVYGIYRPSGPVIISGILRLPPAQKPSGRPDNDASKDDWYWDDLPAMAQAAGVKEFLPFILEAKDAPHDGNYPVGGQTRIDLPNHHLQYAITWFWLAFILPFIYFVSNWRRDVPQKPAEGADLEEAKTE